MGALEQQLNLKLGADFISPVLTMKDSTGAVLDLTGNSFAGSVDDPASTSALATLTLAVVSATLGTYKVQISAAGQGSLVAGKTYEWGCRFTIAGTVHEGHRGNIHIGRDLATAV